MALQFPKTTSENEPDDFEARELPPPSHPRFVATVYYDVNKYRNSNAVRRLKILASDGRPTKMRGIPSYAMSEVGAFRSTSAEIDFLKNGWISTAKDYRNAEPGHPTRSQYHAMHFHALDCAASRLRQMLAEVGPELWNWERDITSATSIGRRKEHIEDCSEKTLGAILGEASIKKRDRVTYGLIEVDGILVGCDKVLDDREIHFVVPRFPGTAIENGRKNPARQVIYSRPNREIVDQLKFELSAAALDAFYNPTHWSHVSEQCSQMKPVESLEHQHMKEAVARQAVVVWFSQVVTSLRKAASIAALDEEPYVLNHKARSRAERWDIPPNEKWPRADRRKTPTEAMADKADDYFNRRMAQMADPSGPEIRAPVTRSLDRWQHLTCALHGAPVRLDDLDYEAEHDSMRAAAYWIGRLKRTGKATIDQDVANQLLDMGDLLSDDWDGSFFSSLFSDAVWDMIGETSRHVHTTGKAKNVIYRWAGPNDISRPWSSRITRDELVISGPMLCFPIHQLQYWKDKVIVVKEKTSDFLFRPKDSD